MATAPAAGVEFACDNRRVLVAQARTMGSVVVVWSYLVALGAGRDVEHARAMALSVLLAASAGITVGLTRLRQATARWLVAGTLVSLVALVQIPSLSRLLNLPPLHAADWALVTAALASSRPLVATVQARPGPFTDDLKRDPNVTLVTVDASTRDSLPDRLARLLHLG